jgi:tetratricopeptide (TPR) repeat protein
MKNIKKLATAALIITGFTANGQDATTLYNEGVKLKEAKNAKGAIEKFKSAIALNPNYTDAVYEMGWCQNDTQDYAGAITSLRKARTVWATIPKVHFELGYAFEKQNLIDSAIQSYNKCLFYKPDYSLAFKQLGTIAYSKDDYSNALGYFAKYEAAAKTPVTDYLYLYRKGFMNNAVKNYDSAKTALLRSLEYKTDYINTYLELGFACNKLKQADEAISYFNKAIALDAKSHIPYNGIAEVYRDTKKDIDMAISWYQKTLAVKADERKACFGMGYCYNSKGLYNDAIRYLRKAIEQENTYTAAYVELGYSYYMTNNNTLAEANLQKALELNSKNENARYYLGLIYINQKNKTKAQQMADELKSLNSKNAATLQEKVNKM